MYKPTETNEDYLRTLLDVLRDDIEDLEKWSVYNNDQELDRISEFRENYKSLREALEKRS